MLTAARILAVTALAAALAGCAAQPMPPPGRSDVSEAIEQPLKDLSLVRLVAPDILLAAAVDPFRPVRDCGAIQVELGQLDAALGPDLGQPQTGKGAAGLLGEVVGGAIGGVVGLPFRGVVRKVSGAEARDQALERAVLSGMVRRGYLKGAAMALHCSPPSTPAAP